MLTNDGKSAILVARPGLQPAGPAPGPVAAVAPAVRARRRWTPFVVSGDLVSISVSFFLGALARQPLGLREGPALVTSLLHELAYVPLFIIVMAAYGLYQHERRRVRQTSFLDTSSRTHALTFGAISSLALSHVVHRMFGAPEIGWVEVVFMTLPATMLVPIGRAATSALLSRAGISRSRVIIVGSGSVATSLARRLARCEDIELVGFVDDEPYPGKGAQNQHHLGTMLDLSRLCTETGADRVVVAFSQTAQAWVAEMLRQLPAGVRISVVPRLFELVTWQSRIEDVHGLTLMDVAPPQLGAFNRALKRSMDLVVSALLLLALSPLMAAVALAIKLTSPGPIFFRQARIGLKGKTFRIRKFRTMEDGADLVKIDLREHSNADGPMFKIHNDPRVTRVGKFLRATSIDEVPQLINVFLGEMSLVGPRPFVLDESLALDGWAARRFDVRPGMTGLWQTSGRSDLSFDELRQLDYSYVASWSLSWDLKILWHTPGSVLRRHGAY